MKGRHAATPLAILAVVLLALAQGTISTVSLSSAVQVTANLTVSFTLTSPPPVPPAGVIPTSVTIGTMNGTSITHSSRSTVTAVFSRPIRSWVGAKNLVVTGFPGRGAGRGTSLGGEPPCREDFTRTGTTVAPNMNIL